VDGSSSIYRLREEPPKMLEIKPGLFLRLGKKKEEGPWGKRGRVREREKHVQHTRKKGGGVTSFRRGGRLKV